MGKGGHFRKVLPAEEEELRLKSDPDGPQNPDGISEAPQKQTRNLLSCQYVSFNSLSGQVGLEEAASLALGLHCQI